MKVYQILVTGYCSVVVNAENEEEAYQAAEDVMSTGDFQVDESKIERTIDNPTDEQLRSMKRHADVFEVEVNEE